MKSSRLGTLAAVAVLAVTAALLPACAPPIPDEPPPPPPGEITPTGVAKWLAEKALGAGATKGAGFLLTELGLNSVIPDGNTRQLNELKKMLEQMSAQLWQIQAGIDALLADVALGDLRTDIRELDRLANRILVLFDDYFRPMVTAANAYQEAKASGDTALAEQRFEQLVRARNFFYQQFDVLNAGELHGNISSVLRPSSSAESVLAAKGRALMAAKSGRYLTTEDSQQIRTLYGYYAEYEALAAWMRMERWLPSTPEPTNNAPGDEIRFNNARTAYLRDTALEHASLPPMIPEDVVIDVGATPRSTTNGATMLVPVASGNVHRPGYANRGMVPSLIDTLNADTLRSYGDWRVPSRKELTSLLADFTPAAGTTPNTYLVTQNETNAKWKAIAGPNPWPFLWSNDVVNAPLVCAQLFGGASSIKVPMYDAVTTATASPIWGVKPTLPEKALDNGTGCRTFMDNIYFVPDASGALIASRTIATSTIDYMARGNSPYLRANADLRFVDLSGRYVAGVDMHGSDLRSSTFDGTDLTGVNFTGADLRGALLRSSTLTGVKFSGAKLTGATFPGTDLSGLDLSGADLTGVILSGQRLRGANLKGANLSGANLMGADLEGADLTGADLSGASLTGTDLTNANLTGATLTGVASDDIKGVPSNMSAGWLFANGHLIGPGAVLTGADLRGVDLRGVNLAGVTTGRLDCTGCILPTGFVWSGLPSGYLISRTVDLTGAALAGAQLRGVDLSGYSLRSIDFTGADLSETTLTGTDLTWSRLDRANLTGAHLGRAVLNRATLTGATMTGVSSGEIVSFAASTLPSGWVIANGYLVGAGANLTGAMLDIAPLAGLDLSNARFTGASLRSTNLAGANLTGTQLLSADLSNATLTNAKLTGANVADAQLGSDNDAKFTGVVSGGLTGTPAQLPSGRFRTVEGYLVGPNVNLTGATFSPTAQLGVSLSATNFTNADLTGLNLTGAFLNNANLTGARLTGTTLTGANLSNATLTGVISGGIVIVGHPVLPPGWQLVDGYLVGPSDN